MQKSRLNVATKLAYGAGNASNSVKTVVFSTFLFFYYNQVLGLSGTIVGTGLLLALCVDAVTDPFVGVWSDQWQSKWGRRHPFMVFGSLPFAFFLFALFLPPKNLEQNALFAWFLVFSILTRTAQTFFQIPYLSLGAELTSDYKERSIIYSYTQLFGFLGNVVVAGVGYVFFFRSTAEFKNGLLNESMYPWFGLYAVVIILISAVWTIWGTCSVIPFLNKNETKKSLHWSQYHQEFLTIFRNASFRVMIVGAMISLTVVGTNETLYSYIMIHFWGFKPEELMIYFAISFLAGLGLALYLAPRMVDWMDKRNTMIIAILGITVGVNSMIVLRLLGFLPENGTFLLIVFLMIGVFITSIFLPISFITLNSIFADIADEIEYETRERKEGTLFAIRAFLSKLATGVGGFLAGVILDGIHFPKEAEIGEVSENIIFNLGLVGGPILSLIGLISIVFFLRYRLDKKRHMEIMAYLSSDKD